jgi:Spy/CpxP family protein refolding chaperone
MSLRNKLTGAVLSLGMVAAFGVAAHAQQPAAGKAAPQTQFEGKGKGDHHHRLPVMRIMRDLNLTDAQVQQARTIVERFKMNIEPQRQALMELHKQQEQGSVTDETRAKAQALRSQIDEAQKNMKTELLALLTAEQRTQYDQLEAKWKARREEMRARRGRGEMQTDEQ